MRLSEAIMLGMPEISPTNSRWFDYGDTGCQGCLVGAALYAIGGRVSNDDAPECLKLQWPWISKIKRSDVQGYLYALYRQQMATAHWSVASAFLSSLMLDYLKKRRTLGEICDIVRNFEDKYDPQPVKKAEPVAEKSLVNA